jgi:putative CocE/NonD family hydrolase
MRDGIEIAVDVVLPDGAGPWPAVVNRTPYMRGRNLSSQSWMRLVDDGYVFVAVDMRGRGDSDGVFTPMVNDATDGHDTIEWVAAQSWCTGRVGMVGVSYEGLSQWWTAKEHPPHLACVVPQAVGAARLGPRWSSDTGIPSQYWMWWFHLVTGRTMQHSAAPSWEANLRHLPLRTLHEQVGTAWDWWPRYVAGELDYLGAQHVLTDEDWRRFDVPALVGVGWWDDQATMATWVALNGSPAGPKSHLLIGGWDHAGNIAPRPMLGGLDVSASCFDVISYIERFLALNLKGDAAAADDLARCRVFRTGAMEWDSLDDWPSPNTQLGEWYLGADGALSDAGPGVAGEESYEYDPRDPVRDFSNLDVFAWSDPPLDNRFLLRRDDVLSYVTAPLGRRVDVSGRAVFEGVVSIDAPDTDLVIAVCDVYPDGRTIVLGGLEHGKLRLAHRNGADPELLAAGEPVNVRIRLAWMHHSFLVGHRIALAITSSWFPTCARNLNGGEPWADAIEARVARVTIHRGASHPSRLALPVEP